MLSNNELHDSVALVTGAGKRLGRAIARRLASNGIHVVIHYNDSRDDAEVLAHELQQEFGTNAWTVQGDLTESNTVESLFDQARAKSGAIDILINNASIFPESHLTSLSYAELDANMRIHAFAPLALTRAFAAQGRAGVVINMLDARVLDYDEKHAAYHLSKRTLLTLTKAMAVEFAPLLRVNGVAPGLVLPPVDQDMDYLASLAHTNVLNKHGNAQDIEEAVLFLIRSDFITGQVIYVDGGRHLRGGLYA